jgi:hypothetical protein
MSLSLSLSLFLLLSFSLFLSECHDLGNELFRLGHVSGHSTTGGNDSPVTTIVFFVAAKLVGMTCRFFFRGFVPFANDIQL